MLKAIETRYKGYRFRSRLEARWAVFFDVAGVKWAYEDQGYDLGEAGWYLPDFRLFAFKDMSVWVEIKPDAPSVEEAFKAYELARQGKGMCIVAAGIPGEEKLWIYLGDTEDVGVIDPETTDGAPVWCDLFGFQPLTKSSVLTPQTRSAYIAARSARFEHGESGA